MQVQHGFWDLEDGHPQKPLERSLRADIAMNVIESEREQNGIIQITLDAARLSRAVFAGVHLTVAAMRTAAGKLVARRSYQVAIRGRFLR